MARELAALIGGALALLACKRDDTNHSAKAADSTRASAAASGAPARISLAQSEVFRIEATPPPCAVGSECEAELHLTALGTYKVNEEYPFKFVAADMPTLQVEGHSFEHVAKQEGQLRVRFRASAAGPAQLTGAFKLSVCNEATCEIEEPVVKLAVDVR
jgi:hypothetical protein